MNNRILGTIAMICAPALAVEMLLTPNGENTTVVGITSFVFMLGWLCSNLGMQQMQATGTGMWGKIVLRIQMVGVILAMFFGIFEATQWVSEDYLLFIIADLCWPLSMLFMIVVGIMTIRANRWSGWQRFVPLICALWLPVAALTGMAVGSNPSLEFLSTYLGFGWTAVAWFVLALIVRSDATLALPTHEPVASAS